MGIAIFFAIDGHHTLLRGLALMMETMPLGMLGPLSILGNFNDINLIEIMNQAIIEQFGLTFIYGLLMAAPVVATLLLLDSGIAIMAKTMPQMNVYFLFLPLKIFIGLIVLAISLRYIKPLIDSLMHTIFNLFKPFLA